MTTVEGIAEYRLDNGLTVLLFRDPSKATITVNVTYLVGSVDESYGETGMAHLLEHMLFKGSPKYPDVLAALRSRGAQFNGSTSWDLTNYFETFDASDANLEWALDLEADRMVNSFVAQEDLDTEMTVVRNEFESGENSPFRVLFERVQSAAYVWHGYGKSPIGSRSDIENVPIERLQAFYRRHYQPDNAVLVVAGRFEEQPTLELIGRKFGAIPRPDRELIDNYTIEPVQDGEREVIVRRVGDVQILMVSYHAPSGAHTDFVPLQLAAEALADEPAGRLYKALVEPGLASQIGVQTLQLRDPGSLTFFAVVRQDASLDEARAAFVATIDGLETNPITAEEVERTRSQALSGFEQQMNNTQAIAVQLSTWASIGDWRLMFLDRDRVREAALADVQRTALTYLKTSNRTVGLFMPGEPDRAEIPARPDVIAMLEGYTGDEARAEGEAFDPTPANIDARTTRVELPNGIKLVMLPKETRGDAVNAVIRLNYGDENSLKGIGRYAGLMTQMLMRGSREHTRQEIQDELARLQSQLNIGGGPGLLTANLQSTRPNLAATIELAADVLREPAFPDAELDTLKDLSLASIESGRSEPQSVVGRAYSRHWARDYAPDDVRYVATIDEEIAFISAATTAKLRELHSGFIGATQAEIVVIGDFDPNEVRELHRREVRRLEQPEALQRRAEPLRRSRDGPHDRSVRDAGQGERLLLGRHAARDARRARRLSGARARQLHPRPRRGLAPVRPHPRPRRLELRRRLGFQRVSAQRRRFVHGQCHLRAGERRESRSLVPRRARDGAARRLYGGRACRREAKLCAGASGRAHARRRLGRLARPVGARRPHDGVDRGVRSARAGVDGGRGARRDAAALRRREDDVHARRGLRGGTGGSSAQ